MNHAHIQSTLFARGQQVSVEPKVKSVKTRELFNAGVSGNREMTKSADPSCYAVLSSSKGG